VGIFARGKVSVASRPTARQHRFGHPSLGLGLTLPSRPISNQAGFALIAVIWSLGLITLLGTAVIVGARYRTRVTSDYASVAAATIAAESAVNLGIVAVLTPPARRNLKFPLTCRMPGGERALITVEEETGKIDLNAATPDILSHFFSALTLDQSAGTRIAARIAAFRKPVDDQSNSIVAQSAKPSASPRFKTILQLDQIDGIPPSLFRRALPFLTVRSGRQEPDKVAASPELRKLLNLEPPQPTAPARGLPDSGSLTIRADVVARDGTRFIREALVSLGADHSKTLVVNEWRHGDIGANSPTELLRDTTRSLESDCFRIKSMTAS
jgi:general secretion pathway protein K